MTSATRFLVIQEAKQLREKLTSEGHHWSGQTANLFFDAADQISELITELVDAHNEILGFEGLSVSAINKTTE